MSPSYERDHLISYEWLISLARPKNKKGAPLYTLYYAVCMGNQYQLFKERIYNNIGSFEGQKTIYHWMKNVF